MKHLLIFLIVFGFRCCLAQENDKPLKFAKTLYSPDSTMAAEKVYAKCQEWVATAFNSAQGVTDLSTPSTIIIKPMIRYSYNLLGVPRESRLYYIVKVSIKQGKVRIESWDYQHFQFYDGRERKSYQLLTTSNRPAPGIMKKDWEEGKQAASRDFEESVKSLNAQIRTVDAEW